MISAAQRRVCALARIQGWFYLLTGLWPWVSGGTFQRVTGFKADFWLAQTVGLLLAVSGIVLLAAAGARRVTREIGLLGALQAAVLAGVDFYCVSQPRTTRVYWLDALIEVALVGAWLRLWALQRSAINNAII